MKVDKQLSCQIPDPKRSVVFDACQSVVRCCVCGLAKCELPSEMSCKSKRCLNYIQREVRLLLGILGASTSMIDIKT